MIALLLYATTAVATGSQVFGLLMWGVWGAPTHWTQNLSLLGSLGLLVTSLVTLYSPRIASAGALLSELAIWPFYAPAFVVSVQHVVAQPSLGSFLVLAPVGFLALSTAHAFMAFLERCPERLEWVFAEASDRSRLAVELIVGTGLLAFAGYAVFRSFAGSGGF